MPILILLFALWFTPLLPASGAEAPGIAGILKNFVRESRDTAARKEEESKYLFDKLSISEEIDHQGNVTSRREKLYEVRQINGAPFTHLIKVNGKMLSEKEQAQRAAHEKKVYQQLKEKNDSHHADFISEDIISRFTFALEEIEVFNGRNTFVISFRPKTNAPPVNKIEDRVINQLAGRVWIDAEEYELARLECRLMGKAEIWGGLLGSIQELNLSLRRRREGPHLWFNEDSLFEIRARKLLESMHIRAHDVGTNFRKVPLEDRMTELLK